MAFTVEDFQKLIKRQDRITSYLEEIDGCLLALDFPRKGPGYLSPIARHLRAIKSELLVDLLDDAVDEGHLTADERTEILRTDVVMSGRRRHDGQDVFLLVEVSSGVRACDVEWAVGRAALLGKLGRPVVPVVAGRRIHDDAASMAQTLGVWFTDEDQLTPPHGS